ncbi:MAG: hypothetical protein FJX20_15775 [Alphaproteobacteria bacterium]|nr:hypothetical protein [Alphaproteobacteria bacterium]
MKVAILAWGSLVWDRRDLMLAGSFVPTGPSLPLEFSRVSRDRRLTLVIDEARGTLCTTYVAPSAYTDLDQAIDNLRGREGMPGPASVGFVDIQAGTRSDTAWQRHPSAVAAIERWAARIGYRAVIWTALASNFQESDRAGVPFSVDAALAYLAALDGPRFENALRYIRNAPQEIRSPLREAVDRRWPSD